MGSDPNTHTTHRLIFQQMRKSLITAPLRSFLMLSPEDIHSPSPATAAATTATAKLCYYCCWVG
jgi:hypothetical protein